MNLTINYLKSVMATKSIKGLNPLIKSYYKSDLKKAIEDLNNYMNYSTCGSISWFGDIRSKEFEKFFMLAQEDLELFITNWIADGLTFLQMGLNDEQVANLAIYGLNPKNLPKDSDVYDIAYIQNIRKIVILGWIDTIINDLYDQLQEQAA